MPTDPTESLHVYRVGPDWVVAASEGDAIAVVNGHYNPMGGSDLSEGECAERLDDATPLTISNEDGGPQNECPHGCGTWAVTDLRHATDQTGHHRTCPATHVTKTNAEWASQGRGFLCSTEW